MLDTYVALIRGINVGREKRVAMADLRALVQDLGFADARTLLNSGNLVFRAAKMATGVAAARIEKALTEKLHVSARVTVMSAAEFAIVIRDNPLLEFASDPSRLLVSVLKDPSGRAKLATLVQQDWMPERVALGARVVYLWCPLGVLASRSSEAIGRILGDAVTARNWATMLKLQALAASLQA